MDIAMPTHETAAGLFGALRAGTCEPRPAYVHLVTLLTAGGRIPYEQAIASLTVREHSFLCHLMGDEKTRVVSEDTAPAVGRVLVAYSPQGKVSLLFPGEPAGPGVVGGLAAGPGILERIEEEHAAWAVRERAEQREIDRMLRGWERNGSLARRVREVADWVNRVETILIYVGRKTFSKSDAASNTLLRAGVLAELATAPLSRWDRADRLFIAAAQVLFGAGRSIRFEEFNGRQLSASGLRDWLLGRWRDYADALRRTSPPDLACRRLERLAAEVTALSAEVDRSDWVRFRRISGLTFAKREVLARVPPSERSHAALPSLLRRFAGHALNVDVPAVTGEEGVGLLVDQILAEDDPGPALEGLLAHIVLSAVVDLGADYAMTSAVRDARSLRSGADRTASALSLRKPDFLCCVLPHPERMRDEPGLATLLWRVAQRMQYNRWHFVPGNFDRTEIPAQRHYFFPPTMPDLAESAEFWHGGHAAARVRFSIRAPGAQLWRDPFDAFGNRYRGCFDIRAVRTRGRPFTRAELWTATRYSGLVDAFWRSVVRRCSAPGVPWPVISAFGRDWYEAGAWRRFDGRFPVPVTHE
jgi:hypothetical protein